jgi:hypothetical protein
MRALGSDMTLWQTDDPAAAVGRDLATRGQLTIDGPDREMRAQLERWLGP